MNKNSSRLVGDISCQLGKQAPDVILYFRLQRVLSGHGPTSISEVFGVQAIKACFTFIMTSLSGWLFPTRRPPLGRG